MEALVRIMDVYNDGKENGWRGGEGTKSTTTTREEATSGGDKEPDRTDEGTFRRARGRREGREAAVKL